MNGSSNENLYTNLHTIGLTNTTCTDEKQVTIKYMKTISTTQYFI